MTLKLSGGRDRSGRVPRASRSLTFFEGSGRWDLAPHRDDIADPTEARPHTENYVEDDSMRGQGY